MTTGQQIKGMIERQLYQIYRAAGHYEQTTHGSLCSGTLEEVLKYLQIVHDQPTAYNLSNLSQSIRAWVNRLKKDPESWVHHVEDLRDKSKKS